MVHLKNTYLVCTIIVYCIKIVSSLTLDLDHLRRSVFEIVKSAEGNLTKTMIYSTPDKAITTVRQGYIMIWEGQHGEKAKCVTHFKFKRPARSLVKIDVVKNNINTVLYFFKDFKYYKCISKDLFEKKYNELSNYDKKLKSIDVDQLVTKTKKPRKRKRTGDTDDTEGPKKKPAQSQQLEPEITHVEISSDDETDQEMTNVLDVEECFDISHQLTGAEPQSEAFQPEILSDEESDLTTHKDKSKTPKTTTPQQLLPEVVQVEMESYESDEETREESLTKQQRAQLLQKLKEKIKRRTKTKSKQMTSIDSQTEISSDEETDTASEEQTDEEKKQQRKELMDKLKNKIKQKKELLETLKNRIQQRIQEKSQSSIEPQPDAPVTTQVERESYDESDNDISDIDLLFSSSDTEDESDGDISEIELLFSSSDTEDESEDSESSTEELTEEQKEQKKQLIMEKINFVVSSDSDSEIDTSEPTNEQIIQSDAITQVESSTEEQWDSDSIHFEISDEETEDENEEQKKQQRKELMEKLKMKIQQRIQERSQGSDNESMSFEISSDEEQEVDISDREILFSSSDTEDQPTQHSEPQQLFPEVVQVEMEYDDDEDDDDLLNDLLVEEDVEKLLERELKDIGFSQAEIDSLFEETTEDVTEGDSSKD